MEKSQWNQFIVKNKGSFLQSWQWGEFQESLSRRIWRLEIEELKALVIRHNLPLGKNYLYCPRGPIGQGDFNNFLEKVKKIAQREKSIFFKIEPPLMDFEFRVSDFEFIKSSRQIQPAKTLILDISKSEEELLKQMRPKTRYNIRLAQKKGVTIEESTEKIDDFLRLSKKTAQRDKFHLHPKKYYQKMLKVLGQGETVKLFLAKYQGQVIVANLVCFFGRTAVYLHGASDYGFRHLMAPYLCQWQAICQAKEQGFKYYDFWGIDEERWPGVTRFKRGFTGQEIAFPGSADLVFRPIWYKIYQLARRVL